MRIFSNKTITIISIAVFAIVATTILLFIPGKYNNVACEEEITEQPAEVVRCMKYGLPIDDYTISYDTIKPNQTLAEVLHGFGFTAKQIYELTQCPDSIFNARKIRPGQVCVLLTSKDSTEVPKYLVFEESAKEVDGPAEYM